MNAHSVSEAALSLGARACLDVPAAAANKQPAFACAHARTRHRMLSLSGGGEARALAACARHFALVEVDLCSLEGYCVI